MSELKTQVNDESVSTFLQSVAHPVRRADGLTLLKIYQDITLCEPKMWGTSIVGFGTYQYNDAKGKKVEWVRSAFSPRKQYLSLYLISGVEKHPELLGKLGKHKHGRSCLNINKLADIDISILKQLIEADLEAMNEAYGKN
jgi:hypothetical protein